MTIYAQVEGIDKPVEFPDGTDQKVIDATVKYMAMQKNAGASGQYPQPVVPRGTSQPSSILSSPFPQFLGNVARGGADVIGGGAQLLSRGANAMGLVPESNPGSMFAGPKDVEAQNAQAQTNIDKAMGPQQPGLAGTVTRGGAAGLLTMPMTPLKFMQSPSLLTRTIGSGIAGGEAAALQDIPNVQSTPDFFRKKGLNVAGGTVMGAIAQPLAEGVVKSVVAGMNYGADKGASIARDLTGANSIAQIEKMTRAALANSGIDYDSLNENVKQKMLGDVQTALGAYSGINPGAVARQAAFRAEGVDPLRSWITRDPAEFTTVENLSHVPGIGDPLKMKQAGLDQHVLDRLTALRGNQIPQQDVGSAAVGDLKGYLAQQQGKTDVLYRTFREIAPDIKGDPQRFANDVFGGLEGQMAGKALPADLREIVNSISKGEIPLTPSTLFQLQKMAQVGPTADGSVKFAAGHLRGAIDRELGNISAQAGQMGNTQGQQAADVLQMARAQHNKTMGLVEDSPLMQAADAGTVPENFVGKMLSSSTGLKDLSSNWVNLSDQTKASIRSQVYDELKQKAFGNASENAGKPAAQATFVNYVNDPVTSQKLRIMLGDDGYQQVKRMGLMLEAAKMQPAGSSVNNSKTGGALIGAGLQLGQSMKDLGIWGAQPILGLSQKSLVGAAQSVPGEALGSRSLVIDPVVEEILKRRAGGYAGLLSGAISPEMRKALLGQSS